MELVIKADCCAKILKAIKENAEQERKVKWLYLI